VSVAADHITFFAQVGDILLSINQQCVNGMAYEEIQQFLREPSVFPSFYRENENGLGGAVSYVQPGTGWRTLETPPHGGPGRQWRKKTGSSAAQVDASQFHANAMAATNADLADKALTAPAPVAADLPVELRKKSYSLAKNAAVGGEDVTAGQQRALAAFLSRDTSGTGYLAVADLEAALRDSGVVFDTPNELQSWLILHEIDTRTSKGINFPEFYVLVRTGCARTANSATAQELAMSGISISGISPQEDAAAQSDHKRQIAALDKAAGARQTAGKQMRKKGTLRPPPGSVPPPTGPPAHQDHPPPPPPGGFKEGRAPRDSLQPKFL
jgi:hypothetical protein